MIYGILGGIAAVFIIFIMATGYVKASPDEAIIVSGYKGKPRIITGTATVKVPFLERRDKLTLKAIKIELSFIDIGGGLGVLAVIAFIIELALIVKASLSARDGKIYKYPLTINFLK